MRMPWLGLFVMLVGCPKTGDDADGDGLVAASDCDDGDASVAGPTDWFADRDDDGYGGDTLASACDAPDGYIAATGDCDDLDPALHPDLPELCNDRDDDCDGFIDEDIERFAWWPDADGDGFGDGDRVMASCEASDGWVDNDDDCDDTTRLVQPGALETCDGVDQDCDGLVDDNAGDTWYADADADGYGDPSDDTRACEQPTGYVASNEDCDDIDPAVHPDAAEACNGVDDDCDGRTDGDAAFDKGDWWYDGDDDGFGNPAVLVHTCEIPKGYVDNDEDCDDFDASRNPHTPWYVDSDGDHYGDATSSIVQCIQPSGYTTDATDCDDTAATIHPRATERPGDGVDQDCDGADSTGDDDGDGYTTTDCDDADASVHPGATEIPDDGVDQDCDGVDATTTDADGDGYAATDCDDADASIHPGATDIPRNGIDEDCDGVDASPPDYDGDGYGDARDCAPYDATIYPGAADTYGDGVDSDCDGVDGDGSDDDGDGYMARVDCDDTDATIYPGATDTLGDGIDQDCDGVDGTMIDVDGDGFASPEDCDDENPYAHPGHVDLSGDGLDLDCDGSDSAADDADGDGYNDEAAGGDDCDDTNASIYPGADEVLGDPVDDDCDGILDTDVDADGDGHRSEASGGDDCDDAHVLVHWGAYTFPAFDAVIYDYDCDGVIYRTGGYKPDDDSDGYPSAATLGGGDCDDGDATISPDATEIAGNGVDEDCDGYDLDPTGWPMEHDRDDDGHIDEADGGDDCDDTEMWVHPGSYDTWGDAVDDDCTGTPADEDGDLQLGEADGGPDCDDTDATIFAFSGGEIAGDGKDQGCDGLEGVDADGDGDSSLATGGGDCDDADATRWTGEADLPDDGVDQDCDGEDASDDADGDGVASVDDCDDEDATVGAGCDDFAGSAEVMSPCPEYSGITLDMANAPEGWTFAGVGVGGGKRVDTLTVDDDGTAVVLLSWSGTDSYYARATYWHYHEWYRCDAAGMWLIGDYLSSEYEYSAVEEGHPDYERNWYDGYLVIPAYGLVDGDTWTNTVTAYTFSHTETTTSYYGRGIETWTWDTTTSTFDQAMTVGDGAVGTWHDRSGSTPTERRARSIDGHARHRWHGALTFKAYWDWQAAFEP